MKSFSLLQKSLALSSQQNIDRTGVKQWIGRLSGTETASDDNDDDDAVTHKLTQNIYTHETNTIDRITSLPRT